MPTKKQLHELWASNFEHRLHQEETSGYSVQGSRDPQPTPLVILKMRRQSKGTPVGTISYDPENKGLKITVNPPQTKIPE